MLTHHRRDSSRGPTIPLAEGSEYAGKLLVVCSVCKRVCDDDGRWSVFDPSLLGPDQRISHAMCPDCGAEQYPGDAERRRYPRLYVQLFVELRARLDDGRVFVAEGATVNVSRSGMLALVRDLGPIAEDSDCAVRFVEANGSVAPALTSGVVVRSGPRGVDFEVAIDFEKPLEVLSVSDG